MPKTAIDTAVARAPEIVSAFAENPLAASQFIVLVAVIALFALAWRGRK